MQPPQKIIGTLLPFSSLKNPDFISGQAFLDWLKKSKQSAWLLLPLHETQLEQGSTTKHVPSPYKSYGVGLDPRYIPNSKSGFRASSFSSKEAFVQKHKDWLHDYALFCALRDHFGTDDWSVWDSAIRNKDQHAVDAWTKKLADTIEYHTLEQWKLHEAYAALHAKAHSMGIFLIGDLPYYPSFRSPLVWAHQEVFQIGNDGSLPLVSGIPDTPGTHFGRQVWGHPLYNWDAQKERVTTFWKMRLRYLSSIFDHIRFDHAKAFFAYGVMDLDNPANDIYKEGPGKDVFIELVTFAKVQGLHIFVEDSGDRTDDLRKVISERHIAGLRIFRFSTKGHGIHGRYADIHTYPANCVAYTTTHDTETLLGYVQSLTSEHKQKLSENMFITYTNDMQFAKDIRSAIITSPANTVIIPMQDWLLTTDRINIPGTEKAINDQNWQYKLNIPLKELPTELF